MHDLQDSVHDRCVLSTGIVQIGLDGMFEHSSYVIQGMSWVIGGVDLAGIITRILGTAQDGDDEIDVKFR